MTVLPQGFRSPRSEAPSEIIEMPARQPVALPDPATIAKSSRRPRRGGGRPKIYTEKRGRVTIAMPEALIADVERFCIAEEISTSAFVSAVVDAELRARGKRR